MAKVCDRCGTRNVVRSYYEQVEGQEIDLCKPCDESLHEFLKVKEENPNDKGVSDHGERTDIGPGTAKRDEPAGPQPDAGSTADGRDEPTAPAEPRRTSRRFRSNR